MFKNISALDKARGQRTEDGDPVPEYDIP